MHLRFYILSILFCITAFAASQTRKPEPFRPDTTILIPESVKQVEAADTIKAFVTVEQMPVFPGGDAEMSRFIMENLKLHTDTIEEEGIATRILIRFIVTKTGELKNIKLLRNNYLNRAALDVVKAMPRWIPGKQNGKEVDVYYTIALHINLRR